MSVAARSPPTAPALSRALGTTVRVSDVKISLKEAKGSIAGLTVANPSGFSGEAISFQDIVIGIDPASLLSRQMHNSVKSLGSRCLKVLHTSATVFGAVAVPKPPPLAPAPEDFFAFAFFAAMIGASAREATGRTAGALWMTYASQTAPSSTTSTALIAASSSNIRSAEPRALDRGCRLISRELPVYHALDFLRTSELHMQCAVHFL